MPDATIDDIIDDLNDIINECALGEGDRKGYFAALYKHVTVAVRDAIRQGGVFEDDARMERLDVVFATRYIDAYEHYRDVSTEADFPSGPLPKCWKFSFDTAASDEYAIMQHMMLGMSARRPSKREWTPVTRPSSRNTRGTRAPMPQVTS